MKVLYFDCSMGAAGDMLNGALVSLLSEAEQESFIDEINTIGLDGVKVSLSNDRKCGIACKHISVSVDGMEENSDDVNSHGISEEAHLHSHVHDNKSCANDVNADKHVHEHHHSHSHTSIHDIEHIISHLKLPDKVKSDIIKVYELIAKAESKAHGKPVSEIHFHEVGMKDAMADIAMMCMLIDKLSPDKIICSPLNTGFGEVKCAHGIMPVPAPATAEIIKGIPVYMGDVEGELLTPTGAALLRYFADEFNKMPVIATDKVGMGSGKKDFNAANIVRAFWGSIVDETVGTMEPDRNFDNTESILELSCNVDDMSGEDLSYAKEKLLEGGAKDAFVTPVFMKKGRSGYLLTVLCEKKDREEIAKLIFKHTSTIGIRQCEKSRMTLKRHEEKIKVGNSDVRVKVSEGFGIRRVKAEYEDLKQIADKEKMTLDEVRNIVMKHDFP